MKNSPKNPEILSCKICHYYCSHKGDLKKHKSTHKHRRKLLETGGTPEDLPPLVQYECDICNKIYKSKSGLWKHKRKCIIENNISTNEIDDKNIVNKISDIKPQDLVSLLMKQQEELNNKNKEIVELHKKSNTINNTNNISINIFLNEHCKDAMNLKDFVKNLELSLEDLNYTGKYGYSKGIANILIKNLGDIDPTYRPIHCTDKKRLLFYVKDENRWEKDECNKKIDQSISDVTSKQMSYIKSQHDSNENNKESGEKMLQFFKITSNCSGKQEDNSKVLKQVAAVTQIKDAILSIKH